MGSGSVRTPRLGAGLDEDEPKWALQSGGTAAFCLLLGGESSSLSCISLEGMRLREPLRSKEGLSVSSVESGLGGAPGKSVGQMVSGGM